ncbi:LPXTG cell wall anchor domain-containing protein [Streptomyces lunaelactis]|uniref:PT domain-containing protein n=1 Tax=Streptomyces lunaelactis TaxID=1535768 RepID=UPI0015847F5D|nr:PT domain-containing protein [Streptomyces lunaelactis]NUK10262.1 LPXTG cell wall anchor domain-containing protein [Streptomyces lunaelactis]NUK52721.1 LPXTG cell wall anchor domain-containing protein [Streptomyces lunaelactis]NUK66549.1 LPXTG cell wall anchor domain-containing protein [Streptomyces lunaelactis]NUL12233.1 LPXTG cell wall anchor domain-containing protein [Streptomyces lunaelactis]NUL24862.1 LPXTG cell wall anchor domain-containing protein [Streptomyces lunaelactis]
MRTLISTGAVMTAAAFSLLTAPAAHATPPGDNGTVKIHDATTGEELRKNEPHVCSFYLDAFGFDGGQEVDWKIVEMPPTGTKGKVADNGSLTLDGEGHGRTDDRTLPDGHYKLIWNFDGEHGKAKHKVFWTECEDDGEPSGQPTGTPSQEPSGKPSEAPTEEPTSSASPSTAPTAAPSPSANGDGDLAETGSSAPLGTITVVAAALFGAGGYLAARRRKAQH